MEKEEYDFKKFRRELIQAGGVRFGDFTLKSGQKSNLYFDLRIIPSFRSLWSFVTWEMLAHINAELIAGVPIGGLPFACSLAYETGIPLILLRDKPKDHGMGKQIEGRYSAKQKVCLIEDVMTTGQSVIDAAKVLQENNLVVAQVIVIVDRRNKEQKLAMKHLNVVSLLTEADFDGCGDMAQVSGGRA